MVQLLLCKSDAKSINNFYLAKVVGTIIAIARSMPRGGGGGCGAVSAVGLLIHCQYTHAIFFAITLA